MINLPSEIRTPRIGAKSGRDARAPRLSHVRPYDQFTRWLRSGNASMARTVAQRLAARITSLAEDLLGQPGLKNARTWRYGRRGSLSINVAGPRQGHWFSFEENKGGDALDLVAFVRGDSLRDALAFARAWLGGV